MCFFPCHISLYLSRTDSWQVQKHFTSPFHCLSPIYSPFSFLYYTLQCVTMEHMVRATPRSPPYLPNLYFSEILGWSNDTTAHLHITVLPPLQSTHTTTYTTCKLHLSSTATVSTSSHWPFNSSRLFTSTVFIPTSPPPALLSPLIFIIYSPPPILLSPLRTLPLDRESKNNGRWLAFYK